MSRRTLAPLMILTRYSLFQILLLQLLPLCCRTRSLPESALYYPMWQDQPQIQPSIHKEEDMHMSPQKRRLVVRVPFAQIPDNIQLNRIYKSLFTQQKAKKMSMRSWFDE